MNYVRLGAIGGFVGAALTFEYLLEWKAGLDSVTNAYWLALVFFAAGSLANVVYWYAMSLVGKRYHNTSLHRLAIGALVFSIAQDLSSAVFTLFPEYAGASAWSMFGIAMSTVFGILCILAGLAVQRMRTHFGDAALWYGIFAMLAGVLTLVGDTGITSIGMLGVALNGLLYILGGIILFKAAKR